MEQIVNVAGGANVLIGPPARPMPVEQSAAIARVVAEAGEVIEAHLPQMYAPDSMPAPAQVLVVVVAPGANEPDVMRRIGQGLVKIMPPDRFLDVWPMEPSDELLTSVRNAGCALTLRRRPWWKFW